MKNLELIIGCLIIIFYPLLLIKFGKMLTQYDVANIVIESLFIYLGISLYFRYKK